MILWLQPIFHCHKYRQKSLLVLQKFLLLVLMVHSLCISVSRDKGLECCCGNMAIAIMGSDWTQLPEDLLISIAKRSECVEHLLAFSSVCSSWKAAGRVVKAKWIPKMPWLMLSENKEGHPSSKWTAFDLNTNKHYDMELPETFGRCCWGCGDGWICVLGHDMEFDLFNPFTRAQIRLPPAHTLPFLLELGYDFDDVGDREWFRSCSIRKVALFKISKNELLICVIYNLCSLAFAKARDSEWFAFENPGEYPGLSPFVEDVISFDDQFLVLYDNGQLLSLGKLDLFLRDEMEFIPKEYVPGNVDGIVSLYGNDSPDNFYLVESFGDLLVVLQYTENSPFFDEEEEPQRWRFEVLKFDSEAKDWVQRDSVDDVSLFVGNISSMAVRASNAVHCKPGCIYYVDKPDPTEFSGHNLVIYSLESLQSEELGTGDDTLLKICSPFWFMPKFG